jgi:hypothetical protein
MSMYEPFVCPLYCANCAMKGLVGKPTKTELSKTKSAEIAYCCGFLRALADYFPIFAFCLWFGAFGDQHTTIFAIRQKKSCIIFLSLGAGRWDHAKTGGAGRNNSVCAVSKSCQTCWPLRNRIC